VAGLRKPFITQIGDVRAAPASTLYKVYFFGDNSQYRILLIIAARASTPARSASFKSSSPILHHTPKRI
jgi:hypothetical protein